MGSRGGRAPNPYPERQVSRLFLRVPCDDWARVKIGEKTEFRTAPREGLRILRVEPPTPVLAYSLNGLGVYDQQLMVLREHRYEPLFAIAEDPEALAREGFESYELFRRYWRKRRKGVYRPMERVHVWRLHPFPVIPTARMAVRATLALAMFDHLYGDFLPE